jgi:hypothetical protein
MKVLFTLLICLCAGWAHAQAVDSVKLPLDAATKRITYTDVVQVPGVSQAELYTRAKLWFADTFKSPKSVIQADEKDAGVVQGEGWSPMQAHFMGKNLPASELRLWYTVKLACREGRYRYEVTEFRSQVPASVNFPNQLPPSPIEELLASWAVPAGKNATKAAKYAMVTGELTQAITGNGTGLAASIKTGMARKPGSTSTGKDW